MKYLYILILMYLLGCTSKTNESKSIDKNEKVEKIAVKKVDFSIKNFYRTSCNNFENYFSDEVKTFIITGKEEIKKYETIINSLVEDTSRYIPDIRAKLLLYYDKRIDTLCMSYHGILLNNIPMLINEDLVKKVEELE